MFVGGLIRGRKRDVIRLVRLRAFDGNKSFDLVASEDS